MKKILYILLAFIIILGVINMAEAKTLKLDPAIMASPLITTIVDACSVFLFLNISTMVFHI